MTKKPEPNPRTLEEWVNMRDEMITHIEKLQKQVEKVNQLISQIQNLPQN